MAGLPANVEAFFVTHSSADAPAFPVAAAPLRAADRAWGSPHQYTQREVVVRARAAFANEYFAGDLARAPPLLMMDLSRTDNQLLTVVAPG